MQSQSLLLEDKDWDRVRAFKATASAGPRDDDDTPKVVGWLGGSAHEPIGEVRRNWQLSSPKADI